MSLILFKQNGPIGKIILNNPDELNAMTPEMADELAALIPQINQNQDLRIVIVTGAGRAFSAGGNLQFILDHANETPQTNKKEMIAFYSKFLALRSIEVPTLAVMNGHAMGAGLCIAMACDMRICSDQAKMGLNFAKIGLSSGMGTLFFLSRLIGPASSADLLFTGRTLSAHEAQQMGIVNQVCASETLETKAQEIAEQIVQNAALALKFMKKGIQKASLLTLEEIFDYESEGQAASFATEDLREGIKAAQEKRKPQFKGA